MEWEHDSVGKNAYCSSLMAWVQIPNTHVACWKWPWTLVTPGLWQTETGSPQASSKLNERLCLKGICWKVIQQNTQSPPLASVCTLAHNIYRENVSYHFRWRLISLWTLILRKSSRFVQHCVLIGMCAALHFHEGYIESYWLEEVINVCTQSLFILISF